MIQTLELKLGVPVGMKFTQSACALLHGVLMQHIDSSYADFLHTQNLRPYSQCLYFDKERNGLYWRINALDDRAQEELLGVAFALPNKIYLQQKQLELEVLSKEYLPKTDYELIAAKYFTQPLVGKYLRFEFVTSCSFKSEGQYVIFPQPQLLLNSLVKRWNAFAPSNRLDAPGVAQDLAQAVYVADYSLRMAAFSVDGARIPAFRGSYTLGMKNNIMAGRIIAMLGEYAKYCGIGIKTALGMGAVKTELKEKW